MKRIIALVLSCALLLFGCAQSTSSTLGSIKETNIESTTIVEDQSTNIDTAVEVIESETSRRINDAEVHSLEVKSIVPDVDGLDDPELLLYVEDNLYTKLVADLGSDEYFIENVSAVYVSEEYLEELEYNSKSNIYFGYTLEELDEQFEGERYIFTLGDNNETVVEAFKGYDDSFQKMVCNVAVGTGVILICVTVSVVAAEAGALAVAMIFATSAKTGAIMAVSSGALSGVAKGILTSIETKDMKQALKEGALAGSEAFKWGAITGTLTGGLSEGIKYAKAMEALKGVTLNGLTTQEAASIQMKSGYPVDIIKQFHNMDEYQVYKDAGLVTKMVDGKLALVRDIDLTYKSELSNGEVVTNLERMTKGYAPLDPATGEAYQLHHIGQRADATLAVLTKEEHQGNATILNMIKKGSEVDHGSAWATQKSQFWKSFAKAVSK